MCKNGVTFLTSIKASRFIFYRMSCLIGWCAVAIEYGVLDVFYQQKQQSVTEDEPQTLSETGFFSRWRSLVGLGRERDTSPAGRSQRVLSEMFV
jgi:hypothetical protein